MLTSADLDREIENLAQKHRPKIEQKIADWKNSRYEWIAFAASGTKGMVGRELSKVLCRGADMRVLPKTANADKTVAFAVDGANILVKTATLGAESDYLFEQIYTDRVYDILILLGFSPSSPHVWVFRKEECLSCMKTQRAKENEKWARVIPGDPPHWKDLEKNDPCITAQSGKLEDFSAVLRQKLAEFSS